MRMVAEFGGLFQVFGFFLAGGTAGIWTAGCQLQSKDLADGPHSLGIIGLIGTVTQNSQKYNFWFTSFLV